MSPKVTYWRVVLYPCSSFSVLLFFFCSSLVPFLYGLRTLGLLPPKSARRRRDRAWPAAGESPAGYLGVWGLAPSFSHSGTGSAAITKKSIPGGQTHYAHLQEEQQIGHKNFARSDVGGRAQS